MRLGTELIEANVLGYICYADTKILESYVDTQLDDFHVGDDIFVCKRVFQTLLSEDVI
jgi:hypothetical protein